MSLATNIESIIRISEQSTVKVVREELSKDCPGCELCEAVLLALSPELHGEGGRGEGMAGRGAVRAVREVYEVTGAGQLHHPHRAPPRSPSPRHVVPHHIYKCVGLRSFVNVFILPRMIGWSSSPASTSSGAQHFSKKICRCGSLS